MTDDDEAGNTNGKKGSPMSPFSSIHSRLPEKGKEGEANCSFIGDE